MIFAFSYSWTSGGELGDCKVLFEGVDDDRDDRADMEFVQNFTPPDFQAKNFTPSISPNFNSFSKKKHKK